MKAVINILVQESDGYPSALRVEVDELSMYDAQGVANALNEQWGRHAFLQAGETFRTGDTYGVTLHHFNDEGTWMAVALVQKVT
ncbi:hypothetical protein FDI24_gp038 [Acidovorax phage ACP17]|uniref:Uncharacterized protein n=1 Tax=Acidovorax phage ACP17 TaxID=2010329 RepID=A0A218M3E9_9CAUD|nr:hypothetical protein FDI24_gp038 [Acidovorax phage ACP17]ASD50572.1 hypothetical protein [Acidovorax phage ACP17]